MKAEKITGVLPAIITPLNNDETFNADAFRKHAKKLLEQGASGFYIGGATGEGLLLDEAERYKLCETAVDVIGNKAKKIVHITDMNIHTTERLAKHAEATGADAISAVPPLYFSYSENDVYEYYKKIASFVNIPLMIYYTPAANRVISVELFKKLFEIDNITAVKWTNSNFFDLIRLLDMTNGEINIMNGSDEMLISGLAAGADGGIGSTYNFMFPTIKSIYDNFRAGNMTAALEAQKKADRVIGKLLEGKVIPSTKAVLRSIGIDVGYAAFPQEQCEQDDIAELIQMVKDL